jgi:O-antigen ligase
VSTAADLPVRSIYALNVRPTKLDWNVFGLICVCVIPSMATLDFGEPLLGARYLVGSLSVCLGYYFLKHDRYKFMSLLVGVGPALSLLRGLFFYKSLFAFLAVGIALWGFVSWNELKRLWDDLTWRFLTLFCTLYWILTVARVGTFGANMRSLEFVLTAAAVCLLSNRRAYLATGIVGISISASAYAVAMLPYGVRLGEGELDNGQTIGNPILMGLPSALIVLLAMTDRGRLLLLEAKPMGRLMLGLVMGQWLILSGSRGSWLMTLMCLLLVFACSTQSRKAILSIVALGCIAAAFVLATDRGARVTNVFNNTVDSNRSLVNRTSGRSAMWQALPDIFAASPIWGWGPGSAADVDYLFTHRHLVFHSLYEQVIAECGLLGFIPLICILASLYSRAIVHYRRFGEVTPLMGIVGFTVIGISVTAFDFVSGIFFGLALMAREPNARFAAREFMVEAVDREEVLTS